MKVIIAYWVKPYENKAPAVDSRPKSIERISTTVDDLRNYLCKIHSSKDKPAIYLSGHSLHCITDRANKYERDQLFNKDSHYKDCFEYLEMLMRTDQIGICFCRIKGRMGEYYYGFQVRNLH